MNSKERLDSLVNELTAIGSNSIKISIKVSYFADMSTATINISLWYKDSYKYQDYSNNVITLHLTQGYLRWVDFSDGALNSPSPFSIKGEEQRKAFMKVMNIVNKYFKESEYFTEKGVNE